MKIRTIAILGIEILSYGIINQPSYAGQVTFFCGNYNGSPATIAETSKGSMPLILWNASYFSEIGLTPERRCREISAKFQVFYNSNNLKYITVGEINGDSVVCAVKSPRAICNNNNLLFTLRPGTDPKGFIKTNFSSNIRFWGNPIQNTELKPYIDMDEFLDTTAIVPNISPENDPTLNDSNPNIEQPQENINTNTGSVEENNNNQQINNENFFPLPIDKTPDSSW